MGALLTTMSKGGAGGSPVPPEPMPEDMILWLDASAIVASDGELIAQWDDLSGNAFHARQASDAFKPKYKASYQNGLAVVDFTTLDNEMRFQSAAPTIKPYFNDMSACTVFIVEKYTGVDAVNRAAFYVSSLSASTLRIFIGRSNLNHFLYARQTDSDPSTTGALSSLDVDENFNISSNLINFIGGTASVYINGVHGQTSSFPASQNCDATTSNIIGLGNRSPSASMLGYIGEIIVYNYVLTAPQRAAVESYLSDKWGVSL